MKLFQTAAMFLTLGGSAWAAADPQLLGLLMPEAKMIAGVQLTDAKASPFGQYILAQVGPGAEFDKIKAATGFDPRTDLTALVGGATIDGQSALIAGRGTFQPTRITNLAMTAGATIESYRGVNIISVDKEATVAFLDASTVILGKNSLKPAIDRWLSSTRTSTPLSVKATETSATSQAWAVASGLSQFVPKTGASVPPEAQIMQNVASKIDQLSGGVNFGAAITMHGQILTASAQDAQALSDVFQFALTMASGKTPLPALPQVSATGSAVNFTLTLTEQQVEQLLKPATTARTALQAARR
ncbi:MAG: hypothetical protein ABIR70_19230 [Bryobacteraceae bacterium]